MPANQCSPPEFSQPLGLHDAALCVFAWPPPVIKPGWTGAHRTRADVDREPLGAAPVCLPRHSWRSSKDMIYSSGMRIGIGSDASGSDLKSLVAEHLRQAGHEVVDYGYASEREESAQYSATYAREVAHAIRDGQVARGVLICGTGIGISISANKVRGIRAAACSEPFTAAHTRENNGSQIIAFGSFVVGPEMARSIVDAFLGASFKGETDAEYVDRFNKIAAIEAEESAEAPH